MQLYFRNSNWTCIDSSTSSFEEELDSGFMVKGGLEFVEIRFLKSSDRFYGLSVDSGRWCPWLRKKDALHWVIQRSALYYCIICIINKEHSDIGIQGTMVSVITICSCAVLSYGCTECSKCSMAEHQGELVKWGSDKPRLTVVLPQVDQM